MTTIRGALFLSMILPASAVGEEPRSVVTIRLDHPDGQVRAIINLFQGSKAAHPAAALSAWKRASAEPNRLGKPIEALISAINPGMIRELRAIDDAEVALWFDPETGRLVWGAILPKDDGTFATLATALVLSGGQAEPPLGDMAVDRLGPPGSALMARGPRALLLGGSRDGLTETLARSERARVDRDPDDPFQLTFGQSALEGSRSISVRRLKAAMGDPRRTITGTMRLSGSSFRATLDLAGKMTSTMATVDPSWLTWVPAEGTSAAFALAIDANPENWDALFRVADRVERVDPDRENVAPPRLRLDLLARTLGVRTDADLLPHLRGISGWLGSEGKSIDRAFLMLHLDDEVVAGRIFDRVKTLPNSGAPPDPQPSGGRWLGVVDRRPLRLFRFGGSIALTWGNNVIEASLDARDHPDRSGSPIPRDILTDPKPACVGLVWPGRMPGLFSPESPLIRAVVEAPPVIWTGRWQRERNSLGDLFRLEMVWSGLDATVRRFLELIPLDPPPDH